LKYGRGLGQDGYTVTLMDMNRLKSYPVIAVTALLAFALLAYLVGALTAPEGPRQVAALPEKFDSTPINPRPRGAAPEVDRPENIPERRDPIRRDPVKINPDRPPVVAPQPPRKLQPGRVDEMVVRERNLAAEGSIAVNIEDDQGNQLNFGSVSLSVNSPGLGWQILPTMPQNMGGGKLLFTKLFAGEYRVRNENPNYRPAQEVVTLNESAGERVVRLVLVPAERSRVEFFIRMENGDVPQFVTIQILHGAADEANTMGRFGKTHGSVLMAPGTVHSSTARYAPDRASGMIPFTVAVGTETRFVFATSIEQRHYGAEAIARGEPGLQQTDVTLKESDIGRALFTDGEPRKLARIEVTLTLDGGKPITFTRVNLRQNIGDVTYRDPSRTEGGLFVWENILSGRWWLAVEAKEFHAAFLKQIEVGDTEQIKLDVPTGRLRVNALMPGNSGQGGGTVKYNVRLRPQGAGNIERAFNGDLTNKTSDFIDFYVPAGAYTIRVGAAGDGLPIDVDPVEQEVNMGAGAEVSLDFNVRAAAKVDFQAVNSAGQPVPGVEFLFTTYAAGSVPETERSKLMRGGVDGKCSAAGAPSGPIYLMIWSVSKDWNNPDKVFQLDLPAYGAKDFGALVVGP